MHIRPQVGKYNSNSSSSNNMVEMKTRKEKIVCQVDGKQCQLERPVDETIKDNNDNTDNLSLNGAARTSRRVQVDAGRSFRVEVGGV